MANEMTVLSGNGRGIYDVLFIFTIAAPKQIAGVNIVETPSSTLPKYAPEILTQAEKDALDAGTTAFDVIQFQKQSGLTGAQLTAQLREIFLAAETQFNADYNARHLHLATRLSRT